MTDPMTSNPASVGPAPDGEWIEWSGGENPVPGCMVEVKIRWREGESSEGCCTSETFDWSHRRKGRGEGGDIIAYRIAPGGVERKNIERAGLWANLPDGRPVGRMEPLDAFEAGKRAATDAILSALSVSPPVVEVSSAEGADTQPGASLTVLVPIEPTDEMLDAADEAFHGALQKQRAANRRAKRPADAYGSGPVSEAIYRAMIEAASEAISLHPVSALDDIAAERRRQIVVEGWTPEHDDTHGKGEMAKAAGCYAIGSSTVGWSSPGIGYKSEFKFAWPWDAKWWKPKDRRHDLVRAGALIVAEIERLDRAARHQPTTPGEQGEEG